MSVEDKQLSIRARHAIARAPIDISELTISASRGMIELNGKVKKPPRSGDEISLLKEFRRAVDMIRAVPGVKDVVSERVRVMD